MTSTSEPLVYRCGFSIEKKNKETDIIECEPVKHAFYNINSMMRKILSATGAKQYKTYMTSNDKSNFRFELFPDYKANRKDVRKPIYYQDIREFGRRRWNVIEVSGEEADDACSIAHCEYNNLGWDKDITNSVVCSFDKDFNNIPGWHYNYIKGELYYVEPTQALRNFYLQILTGDVSDGIPRIKKGWRQKQAEDLLNKAEKEEEMLDIVKKELYNCGIQDQLIVRGRLVWLRRCKGEMWTPIN